MLNTGKNILLSLLSDPTIGIGFMGSALSSVAVSHHEHVSGTPDLMQWAVILPAAGTFIYSIAKTYDLLKRKK